jgi:hypothetical protein
VQEKVTSHFCGVDSELGLCEQIAILSLVIRTDAGFKISVTVSTVSS